MVLLLLQLRLAVLLELRCALRLQPPPLLQLPFYFDLFVWFYFSVYERILTLLLLLDLAYRLVFLLERRNSRL